jgi:hypothetical protein
MSLKYFHIAFVTISTLFLWGFGAWCLLVAGLPGMFQPMGWASVAGGFVMLFYGIRFFKKIRTMVL